MNPHMYAEVASVPGVWFAALRPRSGTPQQTVVAALTDACTDQVPVSALVADDRGGVNEVILTRDPSITHGTPTTADCVAFARDLADTHGWTYGVGFGRADGPSAGRDLAAAGVIVLMGLREGYFRDATEYGVREVHERLALHHITVYQLHTGWLFSARRLAGSVRTHDEPAALIRVSAADLPELAGVAFSFGQMRLIVADLDDDRTYVLRQPLEHIR
ncbi:hypothetical protein [Amycolatopsis sp. NPDC051102]|uniref:hypothetical protein n=1 Tax=Amycolatopsis sp. NPDC051102 TaxID=3155163 RepID=UPI00341ACB42